MIKILSYIPYNSGAPSSGNIPQERPHLSMLFPSINDQVSHKLLESRFRIHDILDTLVFKNVA